MRASELEDCPDVADGHGTGSEQHAPGRAKPVLVDLHRRQAVQYLRGVDEPVPVPELARQVVARTGRKPPDTVSLDEQKRVYTALVRTHLPALEAAGIVECDAGRGTVALSGDALDLLTDGAVEPLSDAD